MFAVMLKDPPQANNAFLNDARSAARVELVRWRDEAFSAEVDSVAIEEPLEIRLGFFIGDTPATKSVAVTMRTPGHDDELAVGFLVTEGIVNRRDELVRVSRCAGTPESAANRVRVDLARGAATELNRLDRNFYTTSSCGVCGKASIEAISVPVLPVETAFRLTQRVLTSLPARLREAQPTFEQTGGLHAAALFSATGVRRALREDVGRHNAVDKLIGRCFLDDALPLQNYALMLSGRASFELIQKALVAGVRFIAAVGAPSSLAVQLAKTHDATLVGFLRDDRYNIYCGAERVDADVHVLESL
ncbi:MAG: FdhD protein [Bradymonadia bacterium]